MRCEYCGNHLDYEINHCPTCGAPCKFIPRPQENVTVKKSQTDSPKTKNKEFVDMSDTDVSFLKKNQKARREAENRNGGNTCGIFVLIFIIILIISAVSSC